MTEARSSKSMLTPLMAALLGAGVALLFAPRSGKETRQRLRRTAEDVKQQAGEGMAEVRESLDRSIKEAQDLKERLSATMATAKRKAKQDMENQQREPEHPEQSPVLSTWEEEV